MALRRTVRLLAVMLALTAAGTACTSPSDYPGPDYGADPTFQVLSVHIEHPSDPADVHKYGVAVLPGNRLEYEFNGSRDCLRSEGPASMPVATSHRVVFAVRPKGCADDDHVLVATVRLDGIAIDRTHRYTVDVTFPSLARSGIRESLPAQTAGG